MSDTLLNLARFRGLAISAKRSETYRSTTKRAVNGRRFSTSWWSGPVLKYELDLAGVLEANGEAAHLLAVLEEARGAGGSFLMVDPYDGITRRVCFDRDDLELERVVFGWWKSKLTLVTDGPQLLGPTGLAVAPAEDGASAVVSCSPVSGAQGYCLYWNTSGTPTGLNATRVESAAPSWALTGLDLANVTYFFAVTVIVGGLESLLAGDVSAGGDVGFGELSIVLGE